MRIYAGLASTAIALLQSSIPVSASPPTALHEAGRCAMRGSCPGSGWFSPNVPCLDNGKASSPSTETREALVSLCGEEWKESDVCCTLDQISDMKSKFGQARQLLGTCLACRKNFENLFCTFTCSPDQSLFINVTNTNKGKNDDILVDELDNLWTKDYQSGLYDSCKDVKLTLTGGRAMDLIGGGAKNYSDFLKFVGTKRPGLGSPFQINFLEAPRDPEHDEGMGPLKDEIIRPCDIDDDRYRCACVDCPARCPEVPEVKDAEYCQVGRLPCLTFAVIIVYSIALVLLITAISGHVWYAQRKQRKSERLQLLQDAAPSDDEDEGDLVHNAGLLDRPTRSYYLNQILDRAFGKLGKFCASFPATTIGVNILVILLLSLGWINFEVEQDPVKLWVSPTSAAAQEKAYYDSNFGPFYRAEQVFLVNESAPDATILSKENLQWWFDIEKSLARLKSPERGLVLDDVCFKPTGDACVVQSVSGWFDNGLDNDWASRLKICADTPGDPDCLPPFKNPLKPGSVLGGFDEIESILDAKTMIVTWVVNNAQPGTEEEARADEWEKTLLQALRIYQQEAAKRGLRMSFSTERSLTEELNKSSNTDAKIVVISYVFMFIYASISLGSGAITLRSLIGDPSNALVQSKFSLGVVGILIVLMSVSGSVGLFSAAGVKVTLIIAEVIPFLVLAVGVDNIFLIVHEFERVNVSHPDEEIDDRIARALGRMGPSIFLSASTETVAFAMGCFVGMPAVKNFAAYAAGAVFINALLQVTMFISILALNQRRVESLRADCFPCITVRRARSSNMPGGHFFGSDEEGVLQRFIRRTYAPTLLGKKVKTLVVTLFVTIFAVAIALIPEVELGLDQRIALPSDSYLVQYFTDLQDFYGDGPPVYFVTRDVNFTARENQQKVCGRFSTCDRYSLSALLEQEAKRPEVSYIHSSVADWVDDFLFWLEPTDTRTCCVNDDGKPCLSDDQWNIDLSGIPQGSDLVPYLERWIHAPTGEDCLYGGQAAYSNAVSIDNKTTSTPATAFRTFHTPLHSQADLIKSYAAARRIANDISAQQGIDVFPYSKHYIFFDQYSTIVRLTAVLLCVAVAIIFVLTSLLLGSLLTGAVISMTVVMIVVDVIGVMAVANISLNAISLVNLLICVGIGVEFCAHIARAFTYPSKNIMERARSRWRGKDLRAWTALVNVGGSVFSGITITKLVGVIVLAFTRSKIFEVYYFRVWLALVLLASSHALIFLPVALSFFGGGGYVDPESDGGLEEDLASRRYRSMMPDDDYDSDE